MKKALMFLVSFVFFLHAALSDDVGVKGIRGFEDFRKMKVVETADSVGITTFSKNEDVNSRVFGEAWQELLQDKSDVEESVSYHLELILVDIEGFKYNLICLKEKNILSRERYYILNVFNDDESARTYFRRLTAAYSSYSDLISRSSIMQLFLNINYTDSNVFEKYNYYIMGWYYEDSYFTTLCIL